MFIGSINPDTRVLVESLIPEFDGLPVFVGCSGNFTIERLLANHGITNVTSNDVSLYSTAIGCHLTRRKLHIGISDENFAWLEQYMQDGESQIATLLLCSEYFKFVYNDLPYYIRQAGAYRNQFDKLFQKTVARVRDRLGALTIKDYFCGDVLKYLDAVPEESVFLSFPPTYTGGYEKLYARIEEIFAWDKPVYEVFSEASFEILKMEMKKKKKWVTLRDEPDPKDAEFLIAEFQPASTTRTVCVYSNIKTKCRISKPQKLFAPVMIERALGELTGNLKLARLTVEQMNTLRSEYMSRSIDFPAVADVVIGICDNDKLLGVLGIKKVSPYYRSLADVYMVADFCVGPSIYKRLSKLVLCVALTTDVKKILEAEFQYPVKKIFTTVFTKKAVSMKYRGLFELFNKKEKGDALNYVAETGRWTLKEAFEFWKEKYGDC